MTNTEIDGCLYVYIVYMSILPEKMKVTPHAISFILVGLRERQIGKHAMFFLQYQALFTEGDHVSIRCSFLDQQAFTLVQIILAAKFFWQHL